MLDKSHHFRRWQQRGRKNDATWQDFTAEGGSACRWLAAIAVAEVAVVLPRETAAIESSRSRSTLRSKRRLLDRMPCRARAAQIEPLELNRIGSCRLKSEPSPETVTLSDHRPFSSRFSFTFRRSVLLLT